MFTTSPFTRYFTGECGFYDGGSKRVGELLRGKLIA